ncbi:acyltransferase [Methylosinus sp. C49]|uniref:acyltransferase family protein n=1 Tax=Methylosinus sp. C49 TaxID=2699395 RepID=UPI0032B7A291
MSERRGVSIRSANFIRDRGQTDRPFRNCAALPTTKNRDTIMSLLLSQFIAACRWMGAVEVTTVHAGNLFINLADVMTEKHSAGIYAWWFIASNELAHQAVVGFFLISGYLVGGSVLIELQSGRPFLGNYFIHRFARIYVVLIPALLVTSALDWIGRSYFAESGIYESSMFKDHFRTSLFFAAIANLQAIYADFFGTNGPLWSLACEFWYYVTFPLLAIPFAHAYSPMFRTVGFVAGVALTIALSLPPSWFLFGYLLWALGAFATLVPRPLIHSRFASLSLYIVAVVIIRLLLRGQILEAFPLLRYIADLLAAILFLNLMAALRVAADWRRTPLGSLIHQRLADMSFSLYCIHMPALILIFAIIDHIGGSRWPQQLATAAHWLVLAGVLGTTVLASFIFSQITEARTREARRALRTLIDRVEAKHATGAFTKAICQSTDD